MFVSPDNGVKDDDEVDKWVKFGLLVGTTLDQIMPASESKAKTRNYCAARPLRYYYCGNAAVVA